MHPLVKCLVPLHCALYNNKVYYRLSEEDYNTLFDDRCHFIVTYDTHYGYPLHELHVDSQKFYISDPPYTHTGIHLYEFEEEDWVYSKYNL